MAEGTATRLPPVAKTLQARVLFALGCGLRASEVVRLMVGDIDIAQCIIRVARNRLFPISAGEFSIE